VIAMEPSRIEVRSIVAGLERGRLRLGTCALAALAASLLAGNVSAQAPAAEKPAAASSQAASEKPGAEKPGAEKPGASAKAGPGEPKPVVEPTTPDRLAGEQQQVADRFKRLEELLLRMAELSAQSDPRRAALLRKAVAQSKDRLVDPQFEAIVELLRKDQLAPASENQTALGQDLRAMLELLLSENRSKQLESEKARVREYLKRLATIINLQKSLQGRTAGEEKPSSLAPEQAKLAGKTGDLANEIKTKEEGSAKSGSPAGGSGKESSSGKPLAKEPNPGDAKIPPSGAKESKPQPKESKPQGKDAAQSGKDVAKSGKDAAQGQGQGQGQQDGSQPPSPKDDGNPARKRLEAAQQRMREAEQKLHDAETKGATEQQEEAIRELEKAKAELEEILRQLREEEIERLLTMLEARFTKMLKMQREVLEGTVRLESVPAASRTHSHTVESGRLSSKEAEIDMEAEKAVLLLKEDGTAVAFPEAVEQMRGDIRQVVQRLSEAKTEKITQGIQEDIISQLEEMIQALQKAKKDRERKKSKNSRPSNSEEQTPPLVDLLAELKMIRALQMRVNTRTQRYSKLIQGEQAQHPDLVEALKRLSERQQRIFRTTRDLDLGKNQ
jgi:hypothetical protein